jgi:hypothetical protein
MSLAMIGRLILLGVSVLLAADGLALLSARQFVWPRLVAAAAGTLCAVLLARKPLRARALAAMVGFAAIAGVGRGVWRIAHARGDLWEGVRPEFLTFVICAFYAVVFLRMTATRQPP